MYIVVLVAARDVSLLVAVSTTSKKLIALWNLHPVRPVGAPVSRNRVLATFARR
jgi:hypothetical protein